MDEYERYVTDKLKSCKIHDKHHEKNRVRRNKSDKDRSPIRGRRYIQIYYICVINFNSLLTFNS